MWVTGSVPVFVRAIYSDLLWLRQRGTGPHMAYGSTAGVRAADNRCMGRRRRNRGPQGAEGGPARGHGLLDARTGHSSCSWAEPMGVVAEHVRPSPVLSLVRWTAGRSWRAAVVYTAPVQSYLTLLSVATQGRAECSRRRSGACPEERRRALAAP
jgi:hypothetical protein